MTPGLSPLCRFGSNPVAEQYLTVEDGCLSPPGFRQQSSVAEHFLAVEDGFTSSSKLLKTVSGVSNIYGTTYGLKYINIYIIIYIENPRIEQTRKLASLAITMINDGKENKLSKTSLLQRSMKINNEGKQNVNLTKHLS